MICTGETYSNVAKMTFAKAAALEDPAALFNSGGWQRLLRGPISESGRLCHGDGLNEGGEGPNSAKVSVGCPALGVLPCDRALPKTLHCLGELGPSGERQLGALEVNAVEPLQVRGHLQAPVPHEDGALVVENEGSASRRERDGRSLCRT